MSLNFEGANSLGRKRCRIDEHFLLPRSTDGSSGRERGGVAIT
jgi:hypothetical protein